MRLIGFNSFFAGIGGFDAGFEEAGMQCRFQSELNPFRQEVLKKNFPKCKLSAHLGMIIFLLVSGLYVINNICLK